MDPSIHNTIYIHPLFIYLLFVAFLPFLFFLSFFLFFDTSKNIVPLKLGFIVTLVVYFYAGYMAPDSVRHITKTYGLVYNLGISDSSINSALATATDPNYGEVNLEYFIAVLQDLHFREIQAY